MVGGIHGGLALMEVTPCFSRGRLQDFPLRRKDLQKKNMEWTRTNHNFHSQPSFTAGGEEVAELGLGRRKEWKQGVHKIQLYFSLSYSVSIGDLLVALFKLN